MSGVAMKKAIRRFIVVVVMVPTISAIATPIASANDQICPGIRYNGSVHRVCVEWPLLV
jgi:hypothetical protein